MAGSHRRSGKIRIHEILGEERKISEITNTHKIIKDESNDFVGRYYCLEKKDFTRKDSHTQELDKKYNHI